MGIFESGRDHPLHDEPRHSSEALATTSNTEIEAPASESDQSSNVARARDSLIAAINGNDDDHNLGRADAIDGEEGVIGFEYDGELYFAEVKPE